MDVLIEIRTGVQYIFDARSGWTYGNLRLNNSNVLNDSLTYFVNGVQGGRNQPTVPNNERVIIECRMSGTGTDNPNVFISYGGVDRVKGNIYRISFYNGDSLVADYDASTGTMDDQSGNGNHATLSGGTWLDDGTGGEDPPPSGETIDAGDITLTASSSLSAQANRILTAETNLQATSLLNANGSRILSAGSDLSTSSGLSASASRIRNGDSILTANTNLTAFANRILNGEALLSASTSLTAEGEVISLELSVNMSAKSSLIAQVTRIRNGESNLSAEAFLKAEGEVLTLELFVNMSASTHLTAEATRIVHGEAVLSAQGELIVQGTAVYNCEVVFIATTVLTINTGEEFIGTILLEGKRELNVYLIGQRDLTVYLQAFGNLYIYLKGGLDVTATNQNFSMIAGDSKYIVFPVEGVTLERCTIRWGIKKTSSEFALYKESPNITVVDGNVQIKLTPEDTKDLLGTYSHEAEITDQLGNVSTVLKGKATINKGII